MAAVMTRPVEASADQNDDDFAHYVCCLDMDVSFCGADVSGAGWAEGDIDVCPDCKLIAGSPNVCPFGGECPE